MTSKNARKMKTRLIPRNAFRTVIKNFVKREGPSQPC